MKVDGIEPPVLQRVQDQTRQKRVEQPQGERAISGDEEMSTGCRSAAAGVGGPEQSGNNEDEVKL